MIYRFVLLDQGIHYIVGATHKGCRMLRWSHMGKVDSMDYVLINSDETVSAWLL